MKIEMKPVSAARKPRYAAALAVLASTALMTGCGNAGEVETTCMVGMDPGISEDDLQIMGDEPVSTEPAVTKRPPDLMGLLPVYSVPDEDSLALAGDVAVEDPVRIEGTANADDPDDDPIRLEGEAMPIDEADSPKEVLAPNPELMCDFTQDNVTAWANRGSEFKLIRDAKIAMNIDYENPQEAYEDITVGGVPFTVYGKTSYELFVRFNGQAESNGLTEREWLEKLTADYETEQYSWGMSVIGKCSGDACKIIFVDCSLYDEMTPEYAAMIAEDVFA